MLVTCSKMQIIQYISYFEVQTKLIVNLKKVKKARLLLGFPFIFPQKLLLLELIIFL